jgi:DNA-binding NtrC family response regulator
VHSPVSIVRRPLGAIVTIMGARATPRTFQLSGGKCIVGSDKTCDVVVVEPTVSRTHLELELIPEGVSVRDLGSTNGTFYLGQRVEKMVLGIGGRLTVGGVATLVVEADTESLQEGLSFEGEEYRGIAGVSPAMRRLFAVLQRLEGSLVSVLVEGESGVGKELLARALHQGSRASQGPNVRVNCGAIPRDLVASELFGHKRGAFTGAIEARKGAFETADGGTLFLDEIGELPLEVQPMLLRALEEGEIRAVGGDQPKQVKVRVIAATNRNLEAEVRAGRFREDLFYRLAVVRLYVPPLRQRLDDIEPLARRFGVAAGVDHIPEPIMEKLKARSWPGNARELRNAVQAYAALGSLPEPSQPKTHLLELMLGNFVDIARPYLEQKEELGDQFTKMYLEALLEATGGNRTAAARLAGLDRTYLGRLLSKHGMQNK